MKTFIGEVVSSKMAQTAVVLVKQTKIHKLYKKRTMSMKKYHTHDNLGVQVGDMVEFIPSRPFSKTKKWVITKVVKNGKGEKIVEKKAEGEKPVKEEISKAETKQKTIQTRKRKTKK
ncbi:MAG: 30S ribosomal protein S17 [bacterium]|nr:30S ribosomal protein S17 [bacterium]